MEINNNKKSPIDSTIEYEQCIREIMTTLHISRHEAVDVYNQIHLEEVKETINDLVNMGLMEISSYNEDGEPLYSLTKMGKLAAEELKKK